MGWVGAFESSSESMLVIYKETHWQPINKQYRIHYQVGQRNSNGEQIARTILNIDDDVT